MFRQLKIVLLAIGLFIFEIKPSLQQLGEWKLTKFERMEIRNESVTEIKSSKERKYAFKLMISKISLFK